MTKRQLWVYNYTAPGERMDPGGVLAPLVVPGVEYIQCLECGDELTVLRRKSRFKGEGNRMLRSFQGFYPTQLKACECDALALEVSPEGQLTVRTDDLQKVGWKVRSPKGVELTLAHHLSDVPELECPAMDLYSKTVYKNPKWEIEMLSHLDMHQFSGPLERRVVLPSTDTDRAFFLRCYCFTYKICVSEEGFTYLPDGRRITYSPDLKGPKSYPENLIANLHLFKVHPLREELEGILDPFHLANLAQQYAKQLRIP